MEDSFGERVWIDRPECKQFVDNIQTAFNTKIPKVSLSTDPLKQEAASGKMNLLAKQRYNCIRNSGTSFYGFYHVV